MQVDFYKTLRSLEQERANGSLQYVLLAIAMLLLFTWGVWFFVAQVPLYETSTTARLEVRHMGSPVQVPIAGRVISSQLTMGKTVRAGDLLVELDPAIVKQKLLGAEAQLAASYEQVQARKTELEIESQHQIQQRKRGTTAIAQAKAQLTQIEALAKLSDENRVQRERLYAKRLISKSDFSQARSEALQNNAKAQAATLEVERLRAQQELEDSQGFARLANLNSEIAELEGAIAIQLANVDALKQEMESHRVRAPTGGQIGEVAAIQVGSVVQAGQPIATIVPKGELRAVAYFEPAAAIGRLQSGQAATIRLAGFPWTQYGSLPAMVANVGSEVRDGRIRVEFDLYPNKNNPIPLQHGLPGQIEVEVEHSSPWALTIGKAGKLLGQREGAIALGSNNANGR